MFPTCEVELKVELWVELWVELGPSVPKRFCFQPQVPWEASAGPTPRPALPASLCGFSGPLVACDLSTVKSLTNKRFESNLHGLAEARFLEWGAVLSTKRKAAANSADGEITNSFAPSFVLWTNGNHDGLSPGSKGKALCSVRTETPDAALCGGRAPTPCVPHGLATSPLLS